MTLLVWDGETLAADRLITFEEFKDTQLEYDQTNKIYTFKKEVLFDPEGEYLIVAAGFSGPVESIERAFMNIFHPVKGTIFHKLSPLERLLAIHESYGRKQDFEFIIVARSVKDQKIIKIVITVFDESGKCIIRGGRFEKGAPKHHILAIGSGKDIAYSFREALRPFNAVQIVRAVSLFDKSVGGEVDYVKPFENSVVHRSSGFTRAERERIAKKFTHHILNKEYMLQPTAR